MSLMWHATLRVMNVGSEDVPDITKAEIYNALKKMKNNKASGKDGIITEAIKLGGPTLIGVLEKIFNLCLKNQDIPSSWNNSIMILLHKKGMKQTWKITDSLAF